MARAYKSFVRVGVEKLLLDLFVEAHEITLRGGLAETAWEERVADEKVCHPIDVYSDGGAARCVAAEDEHWEAVAVKLERVAIFELMIRLRRERRSIEERCPMRSPRCFEDIHEGASVILVAVRGQHVCDGHACVAGQSEESLWVRRSVDKQALVPGNNEIAIVIHLGH